MNILSYYEIVPSFIKKVIDFVARPTHSRTLGIVIFFILVAAVSLTVYVAQQQQTLRQRASGLEVCSTVDSIPECPSNDLNINSDNNSCNSEGSKCKIGNTIYECKK